MSNLVPLLLCLLASGLAPLPAQSTEAERLGSVVRYWESTAYWRPDGLDFPEAKYRPGQALSALVFFDPAPYPDVYWGFCSRPLSVCQAYEADANGFVYFASGTKIRRGESTQAAFRRFQRQEFQSDLVAQWAGEFAGGPRLKASLPPGTLPPPAPRPGDEPPHELRTLVRTLRLPVLSLPEAVRTRTSNRAAEDEVRSSLPPSGEAIIPYAAPWEATVPVLYLGRGSKGIQFMSRSDQGWYQTAGGWLNDAETLRIFEPRIRKHASVHLRPAPPAPR